MEQFTDQKLERMLRPFVDYSRDGMPTPEKVRAFNHDYEPDKREYLKDPTPDFLPPALHSAPASLWTEPTPAANASVSAPRTPIPCLFQAAPLSVQSSGITTHTTHPSDPPIPIYPHTQPNTLAAQHAPPSVAYHQPPISTYSDDLASFQLPSYIPQPPQYLIGELDVYMGQGGRPMTQPVLGLGSDFPMEVFGE